MLAVVSLTLTTTATAASAAHLTPGSPGAPSGNGVQPTVVAGNPTCADLIPSTDFVFEFKLDPGADFDGPVSGGGLSGHLVVDTHSTDHGPTFDFTFTGGIGVAAVFVKGGDTGGNLYDYRPDGEDADTALHSPVNPSGSYAGLSHISFCIIDFAQPSTALTLTGPSDGTIVYAGSSVDFVVNEANDGNVDLTNAYVEFDGVTCTNGNQQPDPGQALAAGANFDATCSFVAPLGSTTITATGHGTYDGDDVTWCEDVNSPPAATICDQDEQVEITIVGINPSTDLDLDLGSSSPATQTDTDPETYTIAVDYGGDVDLAFTETNDGQNVDDTLTDVYIEFQNGAPECVDTAGGVTLAPGASHAVSCATLTNVIANRTITAIGHGIDALGNDVTWCADPANPPADTVCDQDEIVIVNIVVNFGEGCTPGLWGQYDNLLGKGKNARYHWVRDEWASSPYSYGDPASGVFDSNGAWDAYTLGELTNRGGGGEAALGRSASAALQNILHPDISYGGGFTLQGLIDAVEAAFDSGDAAIEDLKDTLDDLNNEGDCGLSNS